MASISPATLAKVMRRAKLSTAVTDPRLVAPLHVDSSGVPHAYWCHPVPVGKTGTGTTPLTLDEIITRASCTDCIRSLFGSLPRGEMLSVLAHLGEYLVEADNVRQFIRKPEKYRSPGYGATKKSGLELCLSNLEDMTHTPGGLLLTADIAIVRTILTDAIAAVEKLLSGNIYQDVTLGKIRDNLIPADRRGTITLDTTPVLIGVGPSYYKYNKIADALNVLATRHGDGFLVLRGPRYVVDYINRNYSRDQRWATMVLSVPIGDASEAVIETATLLWDPNADGPLADLNAAFQAAQDI